MPLHRHSDVSKTDCHDLLIIPCLSFRTMTQRRQLSRRTVNKHRSLFGWTCQASEANMCVTLREHAKTGIAAFGHALNARHTLCPHPGTGLSSPSPLRCAIAPALHVALACAAFHEAEIILLGNGKMPRHLPPTLQDALVELECALAPCKME